MLVRAVHLADIMDFEKVSRLVTDENEEMNPVSLGCQAVHLLSHGLMRMKNSGVLAPSRRASSKLVAQAQALAQGVEALKGLARSQPGLQPAAIELRRSKIQTVLQYQVKHSV
ncbi:MAG: hypothetical protein RMJ54_17045 [Roseiflexaceae bacterium]|nr:hypothetical protein [Roseiflexaceae bacterium]